MYEFYFNSWRGYTFRGIKIMTILSFLVFISTIILIAIEANIPLTKLFNYDVIYIEATLFGLSRMFIYGFFIVKLYEILKTSLYQLSIKYYIFASFICILCGCLFTLFYLDLWSLEITIINGALYILFDFILLIYLLYLYGKSLIGVFVDQIQSDIVNKTIEIANKRDLKQLHLTQRRLLNGVISLYVLTSIAILSHLVWEIAEITKFATDHSVAILINKVIGLINICIDSFCIYLSFTFTEYIYDKLCLNIHEFVRRKARKFAQRQVLST